MQSTANRESRGTRRRGRHGPAWRAAILVVLTVGAGAPAGADPVPGLSGGVPSGSPAAEASRPAPPAGSRDSTIGLGPVGAARWSGGARDPASSSAAAVATPGSLLRTVLSLGVVLVILIVLAAGYRVLARRFGGLRSALGAGGAAPAGILEIIGRYPVGRGASLVLLKLDRRMLLLSQTSAGRLGGPVRFEPLCEIADAESVASILGKAQAAERAPIARHFQAALRRGAAAASGAARGGSVDPLAALHADEDRGAGTVAMRPNRAGSRRDDRAGGADDPTHGPIPVVDLTRRPGPGKGDGLRARLASMRTAGAAAIGPVKAAPARTGERR